MKRNYRKIDDADLQDLLVNSNLNRTGQYISDCPFCGKTQHFYVSKKTQLFDCKKCGEFGSVYKLLKQLDKTYLLGGATVKEREVLKSVRVMMEEMIGGDEVDLTPLPEVKLPVGYRIARKSLPYLLDRGVTAEDCVRYKIGYTTLYWKYEKYILIPIYDDGLVRGFVGRYGDRAVPKNRLRYNNSVGVKFSDLLFGYDEITANTSTVILVEGIFDKIATDKFLDLWSSEEIKCVCTFGKKISDAQIKKLLVKGVSNVIMLYDYDAINDIKKYGLELEKDFVTSIVYTMNKDIDECTFKEAMQVFSNSMKPRQFNLNVIGKLK